MPPIAGSMPQPPADLVDRIEFLFPSDLRGRTLDLDGDGVDPIDLSLLDPTDEDDRHLLVLADHPEFQDAIRAEQDEVWIGHNAVNPRMHLTLHEIVANQVINDDPTLVWQTMRRLAGIGYERGEVLHMVASANSAQIWRAMTSEQPLDPADFVDALNALPGSWEAQRGEHSPERRPHQPRRRRA
jgi:hypothetical protein